ncbi:MAG: hypothetical protein FJ009_04620 [Chloroflexi bacterium]|nr:hypothetical protein [Chloroflexota bacterium]
MSLLTWEERFQLARRFAPRLVLFPEDHARARPGKQTERIGDYHPRPIELLLERGALWRGWFTPRQPATLDALAACTSADDQLILLGKPLPNPDFAWDLYFELLDHARFPLTTYARVQTRGEARAASRDANAIGKDAPLESDEVGRPFYHAPRAADDDVSIQYWFCYFYDDWANQHEGDWEGICVFLRRDGAEYTPVGASYYAHETGTRRHWAEVEKAEGDHPRVYVAAGSHASFFQFVARGYVTTVKNLIVPVLGLKLNIGFATQRVDRVPDARECAPLAPRVELLPDPVAPAHRDDAAVRHKKWLAFPGRWGARLLSGLVYGGPLGPSHKGLKWHNPFVWMERYCAPDYLVY